MSKSSRPASQAHVFSARQVPVAPVVLLRGPEAYLVHLARETLIRTFTAQHGHPERHRIEASRYEKGQLSACSSPSLFGGAIVIDVENAEGMNDAFLTDALEYVEQPASGCMLILQHGGGNRGKRLLDALKKKGAPTVECQTPKRDSDKVAFVRAEYAASGRRISTDAASQLVAALGSHVSDLARGCHQLMADIQGPIQSEHVERYYGSRVEANAFQVADAAICGDEAAALVRLRQALHTGVDPVPLIAAIASKVRLLAKIHQQVGSATTIAQQLGLPPWQVEQAQRQSRGWSATELRLALRALANADGEIKGASRSPHYALEHAVRAVARAGAAP